MQLQVPPASPQLHFYHPLPKGHAFTWFSVHSFSCARSHITQIFVTFIIQNLLLHEYTQGTLMMQINLISNNIVYDESQNISNANGACLRTYASFSHVYKKSV